MTHSGGKPHTNVGDRGQRYEVSVFDETKNARTVIGWSDDAGIAGQMSTAAEQRPSWKFAWVTDRWMPRSHDEAQERVQFHVRQIQIIADAFGYDPSQWLNIAPDESTTDQARDAQ